MQAAQQNIPKKQAKALRARIDVIVQHLQPLLKKNLDDFTALSKTDRCKLDILLAYTIDSLYYMYIRLQGQDPQQHQIFEELKRVQQYIQKIKVAEGKASPETLKPKRATTVNKEAAKRIIKASTSADAPATPQTDSSSSEAPNSKRRREPMTISVSSDDDSDDDNVKGKTMTKKPRRTDPFRK